MYILSHTPANEPPDDVQDVMLLWTDPPYGTGKAQTASNGQRFNDPVQVDYVMDALGVWITRMHEDGTICVCCDYRMAHKLITEMMWCGWVYRGDIVWEFGLGRPRTSWWPNRHNSIHTFTRTENSGLFDPTAVPRARRLAPKKGYEGDKPIGSVWEFTLSNTDPERVGYPNQKPLAIIEPFVLAHTRIGDLVADPFCGSSSTGVAALKHGRQYFGSDTNPDAIVSSLERMRPIEEANS